MKNDTPFTLTEKDEEILNLVRTGFTIKETAGKVFLSFETVKKRLIKLRDKSGCKNNAELINYCHERGLFTNTEIKPI